MNRCPFAFAASLVALAIADFAESALPSVSADLPVSRISIGDDFRDESRRVIVVVGDGEIAITALTGSEDGRAGLLVCADREAPFHRSVQRAAGHWPWKVHCLYLGVRAGDDATTRAPPLLVMPNRAADEAERVGAR